MHLQCFIDGVSARTGFDNVVAEMIENFHKQFSPVIVCLRLLIFFYSAPQNEEGIGSANLGKRQVC
jgi:hypothetical protein